MSDNTADQKQPDASNDAAEQDSNKKTLTLGKTLSLKKPLEKDQVKQSFTHGRSKTVEVEVKKKRHGHHDRPQEQRSYNVGQGRDNPQLSGRRLSEGELEARMRALQEAQKNQVIQEEERQRREIELQQLRMEMHAQEQEKAASTPTPSTESEVDVSSTVIEQSAAKPAAPEADKKPVFRQQPYVKRPEAAREVVQERTFSAYAKPKPKTAAPTPYQPPKRPVVEKSEPIIVDHVVLRTEKTPSSSKAEPKTAHTPGHLKPTHKAFDDDLDEAAKNRKIADAKKMVVVPPVKRSAEEERRFNSRKLLNRAMDENFEERGRSLASVKRARQKHKNHMLDQSEQIKIVRDVTIPETITVGELANRMAVRGADVVKSLMRLGMMVTINQVIDADTAELVVSEFGHTAVRVTDADVEIGLKGPEDTAVQLLPRAPVVTVMGHVDHGKTSLLDALRLTDVVAGEAGGITQHIGAYQVTMKSGKKITFIDTPGHAAFSEMRARGANATDIVVLVVAADDGIKEQTIEAIHHAKAAKVPIVVAINKIDKPDANPDRVRQELMNHEIVLEDFGGDVMAVEVSAKQKLNLEKLEEIILLQAEVLELKANPNRAAQGVVVESEIDKGRGIVATVLIQTGTLKVGDIFVAGTEWGKIRALVNDHGKKVDEALPSMPVEVLGFNGVPLAGDEFLVVESEGVAREVAESRKNRKRDAAISASSKNAMDRIMSGIASGEMKELSVVVKSDVQGSLEAITGSLAKLGTDEVSVRVLHGGVGAINESDVTLARASSGIVIGFNVRANPQAREMARRDSVDIRYYSIIYNVIDDIKAFMGGLLAPTLQEKFIGTAEIREVFSVSKVGKIAGCMVRDGIVKRGNKVRLLRDNVVIHEGTLKTLRRFKDEVKEVREGYECGMAFENYNDIRQGDVIECFEIETIVRGL